MLGPHAALKRSESFRAQARPKMKLWCCIARALRSVTSRSGWSASGGSAEQSETAISTVMRGACRPARRRPGREGAGGESGVGGAGGLQGGGGAAADGHGEPEPACFSRGVEGYGEAEVVPGGDVGGPGCGGGCRLVRPGVPVGGEELGKCHGRGHRDGGHDRRATAALLRPGESPLQRPARRPASRSAGCGASVPMTSRLCSLCVELAGRRGRCRSWPQPHGATEGEGAGVGKADGVPPHRGVRDAAGWSAVPVRPVAAGGGCGSAGCAGRDDAVRVTAASRTARGRRGRRGCPGGRSRWSRSRGRRR